MDDLAASIKYSPENQWRNTITSVAVNTTSGAPIVVGAVPEPRTWLLLAGTGIFFLIMLRLRRPC